MEDRKIDCNNLLANLRYFRSTCTLLVRSQVQSTINQYKWLEGSFVLRQVGIRGKKGKREMPH